MLAKFVNFLKFQENLHSSVYYFKKCKKSKEKFSIRESLCSRNKFSCLIRESLCRKFREFWHSRIVSARESLYASNTYFCESWSANDEKMDFLNLFLMRQRKIFKSYTLEITKHVSISLNLSVFSPRLYYRINWDKFYECGKFEIFCEISFCECLFFKKNCEINFCKCLFILKDLAGLISANWGQIR